MNINNDKLFLYFNVFWGFLVILYLKRDNIEKSRAGDKEI